MLQVCPTDVVRAPPDHVWQLIATPKELARWLKTKIVDAPDRELRAGDWLVLGAGIAHRTTVTFRVQDAVRPHRLAILIHLPLGVTNNDVVQITPIGAQSCRVTFT